MFARRVVYRCPLVIAQLKTCSSRCRVRLAVIGTETIRGSKTSRMSAVVISETFRQPSGAAEW